MNSISHVPETGHKLLTITFELPSISSSHIFLKRVYDRCLTNRTKPSTICLNKLNAPWLRIGCRWLMQWKTSLQLQTEQPSGWNNFHPDWFLSYQSDNLGIPYVGINYIGTLTKSNFCKNNEVIVCFVSLVYAWVARQVT